MAKKYMMLYYDYLDAIEPLNDAERGRLFTACLQYSKTGAAEELRGSERFIFPMIRAQIDRDNASYTHTCSARSESGKSGGRPKKQEVIQKAKEANAFSESKKSKCFFEKAKKAKEEEKEEDKDKEKEEEKEEHKESKPLAPAPDKTAELREVWNNYEFNPELHRAVLSWIKYKTERRESYKPEGLRNLLSEIRNNAEKYGDAAVVSIISQSIANTYKGITWDRLPKEGGSHGNYSKLGREVHKPKGDDGEPRYANIL